MLVAGDDQIRPTGDCTSEHVIVISIILNDAAHLLGSGQIDQPSQIPDYALRRQASARQSRRKFLARQHVE